MTLTAAMGPRPTATPTHLRDYRPSAPLPRDPRKGVQLPMRSYEIAALRADGSLYIGQDKAPAVPLFENAFSAFARGTLISTPQGPLAIEDVQPGDMVSTGDGGEARVIWIGSSSFVPADAGRRMPLVRIMPDTFGVARPSSYVTLGPAARILHTPHRLRAEAGEQQLLTPVHEFADGVNVIKVVPPTPVRLFHICLERHATVIAGGIEMETYHPGTIALQTLSQSLRDRFLGMFPQVAEIADFGPLAHPRAPEVSAEVEAH